MKILWKFQKILQFPGIPRGMNSMAASMRARHRYRQRYKRVKEVSKEQVGR